MKEITSLFLDRDGVINHRLPGAYVKHPDEFQFLPGAVEAIKGFGDLFAQIVVVTNQQGIGKKLMTHEDLAIVHQSMLNTIEEKGGRVDKIYYCPYLAKDNPRCRKPQIGMGEEAQKDFPAIDFAKSLMVGDSYSDIIFGKNLGMKTALVTTNAEEVAKVKEDKLALDFIVDSLDQLYQELTK